MAAKASSNLPNMQLINGFCPEDLAWCLWALHSGPKGFFAFLVRHKFYLTALTMLTIISKLDLQTIAVISTFQAPPTVFFS